MSLSSKISDFFDNAGSGMKYKPLEVAEIIKEPIEDVRCRMREMAQANKLCREMSGGSYTYYRPYLDAFMIYTQKIPIPQRLGIE